MTDKTDEKFEKTIAELTAEKDVILEEYAAARAKYGDDIESWPVGVQVRFENQGRAIDRIDDVILTKKAERAGKVDDVRSAFNSESNRESGTSASRSGSARVQPWAGIERSGSIDGLDTDDGLRSRAATAVATAFMDLSDDARESLAKMLEDDETSTSARYVLATGNPAYERAFTKWVRSPETAQMDSTPEELSAWRDVAAMRAALSTSNGSAVMPLVFDPVLHLTNTGAASSIRQYANVQLTTTNQFRAASTPGVTAEWKVEGAQAADATPTITGTDITVYQGFASVTGSYEIFDDTNVGSQLAGMIADARERLEAQAFTVGSGTAEPWGFVTRLSSTTASRVAATTATSFTTASVVDVYRLRDAVPARHRQSPGVVFAGNIGIASVIQQMSPSANGGSFWSNLSQGVPAALLGIPYLEATAMTTATTAASPILACVNLREYQIADRLGTTLQQNNVMGANGRSTGQWEFTARWRTGGDLVNYDAGRILRT